MTEYKWDVGLRHKATGEKLSLIVWAATNEEASRKLNGVYGPDCEYTWTGTGPIYENNQTVRREV